MAKQTVLEKAEEILHESKKALKEFVTPIRAGICPKCGKNLILKVEEWTTKEKRGFIFKKEVEISHTHDYFACPDDHPIIDPDGCDRSGTGYCEYDGIKSPNKVIRNYWLRYYSGDDEDGR